MKRKIPCIVTLLLIFSLLFTGCGKESTEIPDTIGNTPESTGQTVSAQSSFQITFLDVGQADCAVIACDGEYMIVDAGNRGDSDLIYAYLTRNRIDSIKYCLLSHYHEDHIGGGQAIPRAATVNTLLINGASYESQIAENTMNTFLDAGTTIRTVSPGDTLTLGSARVEIIGPVKQYDDTNDTSIVLRILYGKTAFLFTGDAELTSEQDILDAGWDVSCDVLKVGHHGSDSSTGYRWLRACMPDYAVISVGTGNSYGHPHEEVLSRLKDAGVTVYRTDLQGDIICVSDGETVTVTAARYSAASETQTREQQYILNTNTMKYHDPDCASAANISPENRETYTGTAEELETMGYTPCGRCNPG